MAQSANVLSTLNGLFKEKYADKLQALIPDGVKLLNKIKFNSKEKAPGNLFHQPVILGMEHGVTFASSDDDAFNLNPPVAGVIKDAQIKGNPLVMRSLLGYVSASRAAQGGDKAFEDATKFLVANMLRSMAKKLEIEVLYGQMGYGTASGAVTTVITIQTAEWASGIWGGAENMPIEIRDATGATSRGEFTITNVNFDNRTITVNADAQAAGVVNTDVIYHKGAYGNEFPGIHKILTQTTGTLFNINVAQFNLFKGNSYNAAGALSFAKLTKAAARAMEKGQDGRLCAYVNNRGWTDLLNEQAALRMYDSSYRDSEAKNGMRSLVFYSQNGEIEIVPTIYVKEGYAYLLSEDEWSRVGSADMSFKRPGQGEEFFRDLENSAAYELRLFSDQALFCWAPGHNTIITGIVNSA